MIKILLVCGVGASTGFMAQHMRRYAKENNIDAEISAVSKSELMDYVEDIDVLLIGPHYKAEEATIQKQVASYNVKAEIIKPEYYATMDGENILKQAINLYNS